MNTGDIWFTILRWTILLAIVGAVVGTPVVYFNHRIDAAYKTGIFDGRAACIDDYAKQLVKAEKAREDQTRAEALKAQELQDKLNKVEKGSNDLRKKLADELQKNPPPSTCILSKSATDSLRLFARGAITTPDGKPVPSPFNPEVSGRASAPGDGPARHGG